MFLKFHYYVCIFLQRRLIFRTVGYYITRFPYTLEKRRDLETVLNPYMAGLGFFQTHYISYICSDLRKQYLIKCLPPYYSVSFLPLAFDFFSISLPDISAFDIAP